MNNFSPAEQDFLHWLFRDKYHTQDTRITPEVEEDLRRFRSGEPEQYIIGHVPFLGCTIDLSLKPLISRVETEYWVGEVIRDLKTKPDQKRNILDLCCGSGCIGVAVLKAIRNAQVDFVDITSSAIEQTKINIDVNGLQKKKYQLIQSDLFEKLELSTYDVIFTNPPYIDPQLAVPPEVSFEPNISLFAQNRGFALIERIILNSKKYLRKGGEVIMEFGRGQEKEIEKLLKENHWTHFEFYPDQYGVIRWVRFSSQRINIASPKL